jgi:hypothetical protein
LHLIRQRFHHNAAQRLAHGFFAIIKSRLPTQYRFDKICPHDGLLSLFLPNPIVSDQTGNRHFILTTDGTLPKICPHDGFLSFVFIQSDCIGLDWKPSLYFNNRRDITLMSEADSYRNFSDAAWSHDPQSP